MLYTWGTVVIDVAPLNAHEIDHITATDWARKEIAGSGVHREWVGEGDEEITLRGRVFPHRLGGLKEIALLESFRRAGRAEQLLRGNGDVLGWYVLERISRLHRSLAADGVGQHIQFEGAFYRCPMPDPAEYFPSMYRLIV